MAVQASGQRRVVIVGAGQAGMDTATALRLGGFEGSITLVGDEPGLPYARPPLSKSYLAGKTTQSQLQLRTSEQLAEQGIDTVVERTAVSIEREKHVVVLDDGARLPYDHLVLATGGTPRTLPRLELLMASNVVTLRTVKDADILRSLVHPGAHAVIVGGGYIGLEMAAAARSMGAEATVLEANSRVLARVTSPVVSEFFQRVHAEEGAEIVLDAHIKEFVTSPDGNVEAITLNDGRRFSADFVLLGVGLQPRTELAESAGLIVEDGVVVDDTMRTSEPDILAVGDVARHPDPQRGGLRRLESVPNASEQARCAAATILGTMRAYDAVPWFWSDQYDLKLQTAGIAEGYDDLVVRGNTESGRQLTVLYLRDDVLVAADVINKPADFAFAKRLISRHDHLDVDRLRDVNVPIKDCVVAAASA